MPIHDDPLAPSTTSCRLDEEGISPARWEMTWVYCPSLFLIPDQASVTKLGFWYRILLLVPDHNELGDPVLTASFRIRSLLFCLVIGALIAACRPQPTAPANTVIHHANLLTMDDAQPHAQALAIRAGRIVAVGSDAAIAAYIGGSTEVIDGRGLTVMPGLIDTHSHPALGAEQLEDCSLADQALALADMRATIDDCLDRLPADDPHAWLAVINANLAGLQTSAHELDALVADRPFALFGTDGHTAWLNSAALRALGIDRNTPDPVAGHIGRDASGAATGQLVDMAVELALAKLPEKTAAEKLRLLEQSLQQMHQVGLTTLLEANASDAILATYRALAEQGKLSAKISAALATEPQPTVAQLPALVQRRARYAGIAHLHVDTVKVFADGVLEHPTQSAALLSPYRHADGRDSDHAGALYFAAEPMAAFVTALDRNGFNVHVHAIGDAAVRATLDAFAAARRRNGKHSTANFSISHLELVAPADWPRFKALDVYASFQLWWAQPDAYSVEAVQPYLGRERSQWLYPTAGVYNAGGRIVAGSDWNVSTFNPWQAMAVGLCRCNADEPTRAPLLPEQALPLDVLLRAYTIEAARMLGREQELGSLTVGKAADLVLLPRPPTADAAQLRAMTVLATMVDGRWVYRRRG